MKICQLLAATAFSGLIAGTAFSQGTELPEQGPDDLLFSLENMDPSVDPAEDFYRFAAGGWLARIERPEDHPSWSFVAIQKKRIQDQMIALLERAAEEAPDAPKGSVTQLVGDFYAAYMDVERRDAAGMAPLQDELERIAGVSSLTDLSGQVAYMQAVAGTAPLFAIAPSGDLVDSTRYVFYASVGTFGLETERDVYRSQDDAPRRVAYRAYITDLLVAAEYDPAEAARIADLVLEIESELDAAKLTDEESRDPRNVYNPTPFAELQAQVPNLDLAVYLAELGLEAPEQIILTAPDYFPALSKMLDERPLEDFKDYLAFLLIKKFAPFLSTAFDEPERSRYEAFSGVRTLPPREERALELLKQTLSHPVSRIYVEAAFEESTRESVFELIDYIVGAFEDRIPTRDWLSDDTKQEALKKLTAFNNKVGYPETWIDYSTVDIVRDDPVANLLALNAFEMDRYFAKLGGPVQIDDFNAKSTLPVTMNAAYVFALNGFQVTAAIAQPPTFEPDAIPAVRFCRFGGILGHEATHGFDSLGRQYDSEGNLRNWWTDDDTEAFLAEAQKNIDQADSTEIIEGHTGRGVYWLPENMADVGGITLAHAALMDYLAEHPEEDVELGGYSQEQLCFIGWSQMWAEKASDAYLVNVATSADHPPNTYRTVAPLQHVDAFYRAFGIEEGDPMWLPPEQRSRTW